MGWMVLSLAQECNSSITYRFPKINSILNIKNRQCKYKYSLSIFISIIDTSSSSFLSSLSLSVYLSHHYISSLPFLFSSPSLLFSLSRARALFLASARSGLYSVFSPLSPFAAPTIHPRVSLSPLSPKRSKDRANRMLGNRIKNNWKKKEEEKRQRGPLLPGAGNLTSYAGDTTQGTEGH